MFNGSKTLIGVISGLAAGIALGILFAPKKGNVTRNELAFDLEYYGEVLKEKLFKINNDLQHIVSADKENKSA